ncbi:MAG: NUDIX domain-containing protein [Patescibacteria group bacterium]|nr:NUDIX domain-containing protein [Patescibacteria group bacterium]
MKNENLKKHFTASALITNKRKVLLVNHKKLGVWLYPGGHIESNETPDQTVIREVKEETGLDVEIIGEKNKSLADYKADVSVLYTPYTILCELIGKDHYHIDMIYLCRIISGSNEQINYNRDESKGIGFFGKEDLENIKLFPNFRKLLVKVL